MKAETSFSLKDQLFNRQKVIFLAQQFASVCIDFKAQPFINAVVDKFPELELKQRIEHITSTLKDYLPDDYLTALEIILKALPEELDPNQTDDDFGDFIIAPLSHYVATYGCHEDYLDESLAALKCITKRFSAEDAIRFFINAFPDQTMKFLEQCASDDNYHVRRLASEGTRPKLPWSKKLIINYHQPISILHQLYCDPTRYVTRSVANHLNDISKLDPDLVINTLEEWHASNKQSEKELAFITRHSLRTLIKKGYPEALGLLGFGEEPDINILRFDTSTPEVVIGNALLFELEFIANKKQSLMIDYLMTFPGANGKSTSKVFKLKHRVVRTGQSITITKKHLMRLMTTRRLYSGTHRITLQINGKPFKELFFELVSN